VVICGFSPSKSCTPSSVYLEKTEADDSRAAGLLDAYEYEDGEGRVDPVAIQVGHHNEPLAVRFLAQERGLLIAEATTIVHPSEAWIGATPDAFVVAPPEKPILNRQRKRALQKLPRLAVVEAKTVGVYRMRHWRDEDDEWTVPTYVWAQVQWQMIAAGVRLAYVTAIMGTEHRSFVIEHNDSLADAMQSAGRDFWTRYVVPRVRPPVDGSASAWALLKRSFPRIARQSLVHMGAEETRDALRLRVAKEEIKALAGEVDLLEQRLGNVVGDSAGVEGQLEDGSRIQVLWGERKGYRVEAFDVLPTRVMRTKIVEAPGLAKTTGARKRNRKEEAA
jgi:hypothetical protein